MMTLNEHLSSLQRSGIRKYTNLAKCVDGCVMLTIGEPEFATPQPIKDALVEALGADRTHYAPNQGVEKLCQAIAEFETNRGMTCKKEQVLVTAGATGALFTALLGVLNEGDEVIVPTPAFPLYETVTTVAGGRVVPLDLTQTDFQITSEALQRCITPKTKAIVLNSPHNPTGTVLSEASFQAVKEAVLGKDIFVLCDNVYDKLSAPRADLSLDTELREQLFLCQSFSKPYAMTGWRVGYLVGPEKCMERLLLLNAAQIAAIPTFIQDACTVALTIQPTQMAETYARRREYVCKRLTEMGLSYPKPEGAFYVFADISRFGMSDEEFCTRMIQQGKVAAVPGSCFGSCGYIRLSYCCADEVLKTGLDRLEQFLKTL